ncbi:MAG: cupin domain-containing protein [Nitrospiria bacterium]
MSEPSYHEILPGGIDIIRWPHKHPLPESEVVAFFGSRSLTPTRWSNEPGAVYAVHTHDYRKTVFCIQGGVTFTLPELKEQVVLGPGDRLVIPPGIPHGAIVGPEGVRCIEAGV